MGQSSLSIAGHFLVFSELPPGEIERALKGWGGKAKAYAVDGKSLRGSKRYGKEALQIVTMMGRRLRQVIAQVGVEGGDEVEAACAFWRRRAWRGRWSVWMPDS